MPKILITGNGFDLFHGLPTKYGHFMAVMRTIEKYDFVKETTFDDLFGSYFKETHLNDYNSILKNYDASKIKFEKGKIKEVEELLKVNYWYRHFKEISQLETWIDFENEIENVLNQISVIIKYTKEKTTGQHNYFKKSSLNLNINFSVFQFCTDDGTSNCFLNANYINIRTKKFDGIKVLNELEDSLNEFIIIFNIYLSNIITNFYDSYIGKFKIPIGHIDFIFTFNYTPTIERLYNKNTTITYLHGETKDDNLKQNIVLGIDEIPDEVISSKAFGFSKYHQKIINKTNNYLFQLPKENTNITEEYIFYIFGHSLDRSDKEHIGRVFKFLERDNSEYSSIVVFYCNSIDNRNKLKNLFSFIDKNLIVNLNAEERLIFVEINESNLKREFSKKIWQKYGDDYTV